MRFHLLKAIPIPTNRNIEISVDITETSECNRHIYSPKAELRMTQALPVKFHRLGLWLLSLEK